MTTNLKQNTNEMNVLVMGAGASGSILAGYLYQGPMQVFIFDPGRYETLEEKGLHVTGVDQLHVEKVNLLYSLDHLEEYSFYAIFICTKTYSLHSVMEGLKGKISSDTILISYQNGFETEKLLADAFPGNKVARAVVNCAGSVDHETGEVTQNWTIPPNHIGGYHNVFPGDLDRLVEYMNVGGSITEELPPHQLQEKSFIKTLLNASLNPLCSLLSITMNQAMNDGSRPLVCKIIDECMEVGRANGYDIPEQQLQHFLMNYLMKGGDHYPSMWWDLNANMPTEIEFINGKIVELALRNGLEAPYNLMLTSFILAKEVATGVRGKRSMPHYLYSDCQRKCGHMNARELQKACYASL
ncbi:MAG: ketopantoate reductase family protein [bacterium]|nr:ketopantoate reductase family protein [bacterium]